MAFVHGMRATRNRPGKPSEITGNNCGAMEGNDWELRARATYCSRNKYKRRVCDCRSRSPGGGDHRGLDYLCVRCTCLARVTAVDIDANLTWIAVIARLGNDSEVTVLCPGAGTRSSAPGAQQIESVGATE